MKVIGNLDVTRRITSRRSDQGLTTITLTAAQQVDTDKYSSAWMRLTPIDAISSAKLPDATTLENGFQIVLHDDSSFAMDALYDDLSVIKAMGANEAYLFTLLDNTTTNGVWHINFLEDVIAPVPATRYCSDFLIGDFSQSGSLYELTVTQASHTRGVDPMFQVMEFAIQSAFAEFVGNVNTGSGLRAYQIRAGEVGVAHNALDAFAGASNNTKTVNTLLGTDFTTANPGLTVVLIDGDGTQQPQTGQTATLTGGVDASQAEAGGFNRIKVIPEEETLNIAGDARIAVSFPDLLEPDTDGRFDGRICLI